MPRDTRTSGHYSIGQFSRLSNITIKTLRYYDAEGILKPAHVDEASAYRYYTAAQLEDARLLQQLRFMHVPLDILRDFMRRPTAAHQQEVLDVYVARLEDEVESLTGRIRGIQRRRTYPRDARPYEVYREDRPSVPFVYVHYEVGLSGIEDARALAFQEVRTYLAAAGVAPISAPMCMSAPHATARSDQFIASVNAGFEVQEPLAGDERVRSGWTPGGTWYGALHHGLYDYLGYAKAPTFQRARDDGVPVGRGAEEFWHAEVYRIGPWDTPDLATLVTDVRWLIMPVTLGSVGEER